MIKYCTQCPRHCPTNRRENLGFCSAGNVCEVSKIMLHYWEEPIISGDDTTLKKGSGAIFFTHCNLKCVYCQNYEISQQTKGEYFSAQKLAQTFEELENQGATNINLVTPTQYSESILTALKIYKPKIPVVWNCGGYEDEQMLVKLSNYVDIFLADFKYYDNNLAKCFSACPDYAEKCQKALLKMREIVGEDLVENGLMKKGLIVRHLVLPNCTNDSIKILNWIKENLGKKTYISLMSQYTPCGKAKEIPTLNRTLKKLEYKRVLHHLEKLDFENGFTQDMNSASQSFIPDFQQK